MQHCVPFTDLTFKQLVHVPTSELPTGSFDPELIAVLTSWEEYAVPLFIVLSPLQSV
jgi:hypothetical protein